LNDLQLREFSKIEVRLNSGREVAAILCSVDVLKMRSSFFHEVLNHQEDGLRSSEDFITAMRAPIELPEESPYEAAAFLESLHEGRAVYQGEWNSCWARLRYTCHPLGFLQPMHTTMAVLIAQVCIIR